jgi:hypothetical protein
MSARFGCVVLTGGGRAAALERAVASLQAQEGVEVDVAVVFNGTPPTGLPTVARVVELPEPVGIPAGRNAGVAAVDGELLFFLDDDATLRDRDTLARVAALLEAQPSIGCVQLRVDVDAADASTPPARTWVPRLRVGDRTRSSDVAALWEGAVAIRRGLFEQVGGWPGDFRYVHEGVALAWSVMDAGFRVRYAGDRPADPRAGRVAARPGRHPRRAQRGRGRGRRRAVVLPRRRRDPARPRHAGSRGGADGGRAVDRLRAAARRRRRVRPAPQPYGSHAVADDPRRASADHLIATALGTSVVSRKFVCSWWMPVRVCR